MKRSVFFFFRPFAAADHRFSLILVYLKKKKLGGGGGTTADPTADVEGFDVQAKIALLTKLAFGATVSSELVRQDPRNVGGGGVVELRRLRRLLLLMMMMVAETGIGKGCAGAGGGRGEGGGVAPPGPEVIVQWTPPSPRVWFSCYCWVFVDRGRR